MMERWRQERQTLQHISKSETRLRGTEWEPDTSDPASTCRGVWPQRQLQDGPWYQ
jgi:hypothetical protein